MTTPPQHSPEPPAQQRLDQTDVFAAATGAAAFGSAPRGGREAGRGGAGGDWRARLRESKLGTVAVLGVTAAAVALGAWLLGGGGQDAATTAGGATSGAVTAVDLDVDGRGPAPELGQAPQNFTATTIDGEQLDLADLRGRPVWLLFGATWCSACRAEQPDVQAAAEKYGEDLVIVSVYLGEDQRAVSDYSERLGINYPQVPDPTSEISASYRVMGVPSHFFLDSDGILRGRTIGALSPADIDEELEVILASQ